MEIVSKEHGRKEVTLPVTLLTGAAVLALWALSWGLSYVSLGAWALPVALGIAALKAALVVLFFMEAVVENASIHTAGIAGAAMVVLMISFMVADVRTRETPPLEAPPAGATSR